jgi:hypothetical protein
MGVKASFQPKYGPFVEWVKLVVHGHLMDPNNPKDLDKVLLCSKASQIATRYTRMKAYGNHDRMEDSKCGLLQTYDSKIALVFDVPIYDVANVSVNYVGVFKDILKFILWPNPYPYYHL